MSRSHRRADSRGGDRRVETNKSLFRLCFKDKGEIGEEY